MTSDFDISAGAAQYLNLTYNPNTQNQQDQQGQQGQDQVNDQHQLVHRQQLQHQHHPHHQFQNFGYPAASNPQLLASAMTSNNRTWPVMDMNAPSNTQAHMSPASRSPETHQSSSPNSHHSSPHTQHSSLQPSPFPSAANQLTDWALNQQQATMAAQQRQHHHQQQQQQNVHHPDMSQFVPDPLMGFNTFNNMPATSLEYFPPTTAQAIHANLLDPNFGNLPAVDEATHAMHWGGAPMDNWHDFQSTLQMDGLPRLGSVGSNSPTNTYLEVLSLPSSSGEGWSMVDWNQPGMDQYSAAQGSAIFNPSQTLHLRTGSGSSDGSNSMDIGSFEEISFPYSPSFSNASDGQNHRPCYSSDGHHHHHHHHTHGSVSPTAPAPTLPAPIKTEPVSARHSPGSGAGSSSPPSSAGQPRGNSGPRRSPIAKTNNNKTVVRRISNGKKDGAVEKKVGRRKGPLLPEQRKQASEIRKLRACLRCKFLKKTCDKGEPCAGCQPSHARLWQVPCTRIDIKDIGYFMKDWKADYERHLHSGVSVYNVKGFSQKETLMWITHGYGFALPIKVRQVYVTDDSCFDVDWVESHNKEDDPIEFETRSEKLDVGAEGVDKASLMMYLDSHIEGPFEDFIDDHFEGTPFITEILKTAHRFYKKQPMPVIKNALKLVLAYNLTFHITLVENQGAETEMDGAIDDEGSKFYGRTVAPVLVNFQIKLALADMWRELQKEILEELSSLYSGVYSTKGQEKHKNWPTIFMLAAILLAVWEEMQFDSHYRMPDPQAVSKFCNDMETTPVGVIVGLFHAISQKVPAFTDWDTRKHGHILFDNVAACDAMTDMRTHILNHETYLRSRKTAEFKRDDFDCLSNKFVSKLVIRAN
ncbi:uncharacterized protein J7T54_006370 [Emericellopsis cladophorae]|uniref:C6 finger domain-containing protein n=1 Tax=Emericellopsis cladophorae TaxID=2686198 RepID=A0A9Q0BH34_9HYPO|nr:uncharacterized protein J7T54_006370 [Emericellopsis cladophorae]KAI6784325.1 hypothetical protein J7T54_006370 [Emericellopsis cladophorae]